MGRLLAVAPALLALAAFGVPAAEAAPNAETGSATNLTSTDVTLTGTVDPGGVTTVWYFELGPATPASRLDTKAQVVTSPGPVTASVSGLAPGTRYSYRLVAVDADGIESVDTQYLFWTPPVAPAVTGASMATATTSLLSGIVVGGSASATGLYYWFEYGTTTTYTGKTFRQAMPAASGLQPVSMLATGLIGGTTYHYRLVVSASPTALGSASPDATFSTGGTTLAPTPGLVALPADAVSDAFAIVHASMPPGQNGTFQFEYGLSSSYGALTEPKELTTTTTAVDAGLQNLLPSQTYHYRLLLSTAQGVLVSGDMTLTTLGDATGPSVSLGKPSCKAARACTLTGSASDDALAGVEVSVVLKTGKTCRAFTGKRFVKRSCSAAAKTFVDAWTSRSHWMLQVPTLKGGSYRITVRAADRSGNEAVTTRTLHVVAKAV